MAKTLDSDFMCYWWEMNRQLRFWVNSASACLVCYCNGKYEADTMQVHKMEIKKNHKLSSLSLFEDKVYGSDKTNIECVIVNAYNCDV